MSAVVDNSAPRPRSQRLRRLTVRPRPLPRLTLIFALAAVFLPLAPSPARADDAEPADAPLAGCVAAATDQQLEHWVCLGYELLSDAASPASGDTPATGEWTE